jgi:hypothetical protein
MPSTPVIDEGKVLQMLEGPASTVLAARLNAGGMMAIMAAHDRKLPREAFQEILEVAVDMQRAIIRLQTLEVISKYMTQANYQEEMAKNVQYCATQGEICRKNLEFKMNMIAQCPWEGDTIN